MNKYEVEEWEANHEMPHDHLMDVRGIRFKDLSGEIQRKISAYNLVYDQAIRDGFIDEMEEQLLITASYKIAEQIKIEHPKTTDE